MEQTKSSKLLHAAEIGPIVKALFSEKDDLRPLEIPSFQELLDSNPAPFAYTYSFHEAKNNPIVVLHSSGSTGPLKPITMTHATFSVLYNE